MILTRSFLRRKVLYLLCAALLTAGIVQIESHQGTLDGMPCPFCPDHSQEGYSTYCYNCNTPHYGIVEGYNHEQSPPEPMTTIGVSACAGPMDASASTSLGMDNLQLHREDATYHGTAEGYAGNGTPKSDYPIWIIVKDGETFWSGAVNLAKGLVGIGGEGGRTSSTRTTKTEELSLVDYRLPTYNNSAQIRGWVATPDASNVSNSTRADFQGSDLDFLLGSITIVILGKNPHLQSCNNADYQ